MTRLSQQRRLIVAPAHGPALSAASPIVAAVHTFGTGPFLALLASLALDLRVVVVSEVCPLCRPAVAALTAVSDAL